MRYVEERVVSARPPEEELTERCDDGLDNILMGILTARIPSVRALWLVNSPERDPHSL